MALFGCSPSTEQTDAVGAERVFLNGAKQMGLEAVQDSIEVGKRADFVVLDRKLFELPAAQINEASVVMTIFDGRTVNE